MVGRGKREGTGERVEERIPMTAQLTEGYHGVRRLLSRDSQKTGNPVATVPPGSRDPIYEASLLTGYGLK